jgi:hypothetical protein
MSVFKNTLAAALTLFNPKIDATPAEFKSNKDGITIVQEESLNSKENGSKTINFEQVKSEKNGSTKEDRNFSDEGSKKFSNNEKEFKVTSENTVGRVSKGSLIAKTGNYIRSGGLGYLGALAENAPTLIKAGVTGIALYNVLDKTLGSSNKHGSLINRVTTLTQKFAEGQLATQAMGDTMKFDTKTFFMAALALSGGGQMQQLLGQASGIDLSGGGGSSGIGGR